MAEPLGLNTVIGFGGTVENGLLFHPDGRTLIYPLGSTIVLRDKKDARAQEFLQGHSDKVSITDSITSMHGRRSLLQTCCEGLRTSTLKVW
jgi:hypothetical protein